MDFIILAIKELEKQLKEFESEVTQSERRRKDFIKHLEEADETEIEEFKRNTLYRAEIAKALQSLERSLKNSTGTFERFSKQVDKDLARVSKHTPNEPLNKRHPFILKKLDALKRTEQQLDFLAVEMEKMADAINWKMLYADRNADKVFKGSAAELSTAAKLFEAQSFEFLCKRMKYLQQELAGKFG